MSAISRKLRSTFAIFWIVLSHAAFAWLLYADPIEVRRIPHASAPMLAELWGEEIGTAENAQSPRTAELRVLLAVPDLPADSMPEPAIEVPRIDPDHVVESAPFAGRAHLRDGAVATVLLALQIAADGSVLSARIVRSDGDESVNTAAVDYARATRWIPGSIDGAAQPMEASLTVILGENA
jgi:TonB family protein